MKICWPKEIRPGFLASALVVGFVSQNQKLYQFLNILKLLKWFLIEWMFNNFHKMRGKMGLLWFFYSYKIKKIRFFLFLCCWWDRQRPWHYQLIDSLWDIGGFLQLKNMKKVFFESFVLKKSESLFLKENLLMTFPISGSLL